MAKIKTTNILTLGFLVFMFNNTSLFGMHKVKKIEFDQESDQEELDQDSLTQRACSKEVGQDALTQRVCSKEVEQDALKNRVSVKTESDPKSGKCIITIENFEQDPIKQKAGTSYIDKIFGKNGISKLLIPCKTFIYRKLKPYKNGTYRKYIKSYKSFLLFSAALAECLLCNGYPHGSPCCYNDKYE